MNLADALGLRDRELVAFVGAGGKKTAMHQLVSEADERGITVGYTTTTHVPPPDLPLVVTSGESVVETLAGSDSPLAFASGYVSDPERVSEKLRGFTPDVIDDIYRDGRFDWLLVKADGARQREFKAPGPDEPALPAEATLIVPVAAVTAVGAPLSDERVHRVDRVAALTGLSPGDELDAQAVGTVLASHDGGLKGVPSGTAVVPLINKADTPALLETARAILTHAFAASDRLNRGLVTSFRTGTCEVVTSDDGGTATG